MRILILSNDHLYANLALKDFLKQYQGRIVALILPDFIIPNKSWFESIIFLLKKSFIQFLLYKWFEGEIYHLKTGLGWGQLKPFRESAQKYHFPLLKTKNINSSETAQLIKRLKPEVIYSLAFPQRIKPEIFTIPKKGCINFHDSLLPRYRGLCAYFWVTANDEKETGVTANLIDNRLDTGKIVMQRRLAVSEEETMQKIYYHTAKLMGEMILKIQRRLDRGNIKLRFQPKENSSYYSWPNKKGYQLFKKNQKKFFKLRELWQSI